MPASRRHGVFRPADPIAFATLAVLWPLLVGAAPPSVASVAGTAPPVREASAGEQPAGPSSAPPATAFAGTGEAPSPAETAAALRDAIWRFERVLRDRLSLAVATERSPAAVRFDPESLQRRLDHLRAAAWDLGGERGAELERKTRALRPLLTELRRLETDGSPLRSDSPWSPAALRSARSVDAASHSSCSEALAVGDGAWRAAVGYSESAGEELWLRYTAPAGGYALASTAGSDVDTVIEVHDTCPAAGAAPLARGDDELGLQARVGFRVATGESRWIRIAAADGASGSLAVRLGGGVAGFAGIATREATGEPLSFIAVDVWDASGAFVTAADTNGDGVYAAVGLAPGTYFASTRTFSNGLVDELYDDLLCPGGAPQGCDPTAGTPIVVPSGEVLTDIDFALPDGAAVAGRVRDEATGLPLRGVEVRVFGPNGGQIESAFTDVAGRYTVRVLGDGVVFALAGDPFGSEYVRELYQGIPCPGSCDVTTGTPIPVTVGTTTSGIDFSLDRRGEISGTVTRAVDGAPVTFEEVVIWDDQGTFASSAFTDASGEYRAVGLESGTYFATTQTFGDFADELYDDLPCFPAPLCDPTTGTPIAVTLGSTTSGIDFALNRLGTVSGAVTEAVGGPPIDFFDVVLYDSSGSFAASEFGFDGFYEFTGIAPGTYFAIVFPELHQTELYDDLPCPGGPPAGCDPTTGTPIAVALDTATTGIDFALAPLGAIAGTVTESGTGFPLDDFVVEVWNAAGQIVEINFFDGGTYQIEGLDAGTYFVSAEQADHVAELYDDLPCPAGPPGGCDPTTGTPVAVSLSSTTSGIDFALDPEGSLSGTVRDGSTAQPIPFANLQVFDAAGSFVSSVSADSGGDYEVRGLETGDHFVLAFASGYTAQLYDGIPCPAGNCDAVTGTPVPVTLGAETGGIDFDLEPLGTITGVVSSTLGGPLQSANVTLFDAGGDAVDFDLTDFQGRYSFPAAAGTWFVIAGDLPDHAAQLYDGIPCPGGSCDPTTGTPVPVTSGATTDGIDFELEPASGIVGRVTDGAREPVPGVAIDLWDAAGVFEGATVSGPDGFYRFDPEAGTFFVSTDNGLGALDEVFDDVPCPLGPAHQGLCDPLTGDPVVVPTFDSLVTDIDFALSGVPLFTDGFESGDLSAWSSVQP